MKKDNTTQKLAEIPFQDVKLDLLYFAAVQQKPSGNSRDADGFNENTFIPLCFKQDKLKWVNEWLEAIEQEEEEEQENQRVSQAQKDRILQEQLKQKLAILKKEKEKKEMEIDNFNQTLSDLKKEIMIYEIKNKLLQKLIEEKQNEYQNYVDRFYMKEL
ncbi:hypothetical protein TTHERM_00526830 (macronuclear) [Tetrahymena thermophila SB210]|uniref:Uncharacterized protein n=1 Tax=Tetrahymena thermophila (strain SB210) TaxID=312017 RepID=I7M4Q5_TETTS|nr:hypothetical protein TTHERM_00526830 [Tetrahymena thermophila SB210]EAS07852.2 hypothetical protein TTHERM_00526830 [Tetrahymena thermophila SB210]|eukprot:XP_001028094.2 hypothetical protein TTHERM_00526830 [Tetrahymena thermophila SB210]